MLISSVIIALIALSGLALTYPVAENKSFLWRIAAGNIIGSAIFGLVGFLLAMAFGLTALTTGVALVLTCGPLALLLKRFYGKIFKNDWAKAKGKFQGGNLKRFSGFAFYAFFAVVFWLFFSQTMYTAPDGIYTGGSNNLGDLPFHLGTIFGFTEGNNFPPQNPSFAGARFSYPFIADFLTACFVKLGADVKDALFLQNFTWAFSLLVILERFIAKLTSNKLAGRIAPFLLFFSGGLGFVWFLKDYWTGAVGLWEFIWHIPRDYTISDDFRWGNSMVVLFITQRSLLLGMPLTVLVLGYLWRVFAGQEGEEAQGDKVEKGKSEKFSVDDGATNFFTFARFHFSPFVVGLVAGMLPLIHLHSLVVLFVVTAFLFFFRMERWREWVAFGAGVCVIAVPELVWTMAGSATETSKFIGWQYGWNKKPEENILWFWLKNTGVVLPIIGAGIYLLLSPQSRRDAVETKAQDQSPKVKGLLFFYIPFAFLFLVSNIVKLAPWEWDNIKVLIYWFVGSLPLMSYGIARIWKESSVLRFAALVLTLLLTFAGALDVWRTASSQNKIRVFDTDAIRIAEQIKGKTAPDALFLNAPTYNTAVVLSGRRSFVRYIGHLASHGIDYGEREDHLKRIYQGGGVADIFLREDQIEYVLISPEERKALGANEEYFKKYPLIAESGQYRVYKIK